MKISREEALDILHKDNPDFTTVSDEVVEAGRWSVYHELIVHNAKEDKYYRAEYSVGATEYQDEYPWDYDAEVLFKEVTPIQKTIIVYE